MSEVISAANHRRNIYPKLLPCCGRAIAPSRHPWGKRGNTRPRGRLLLCSLSPKLSPPHPSQPKRGIQSPPEPRKCASLVPRLLVSRKPMTHEEPHTLQRFPRTTRAHPTTRMCYPSTKTLHPLSRTCQRIQTVLHKVRQIRRSDVLCPAYAVTIVHTCSKEKHACCSIIPGPL